MSIGVVLVDDHRLFREGLRTLMGRLDGVAVVGEAGDGRTAVSLARELQPDVVVMDVAMPHLNGIEATRQIVSEVPTTRVVALSMHTTKQTVVEALRAGASGYVVKLAGFEEVAEAVMRVALGERYLSPAVAGVVLEELVNPGGTTSALALLTPREREVMQLLVEGHNTKEVANELSISARTVDVHRKRLMDKLEMKSVAELTRYAMREGLFGDE